MKKRKNMKEIIKRISSYERWLMREEIRQDDIDREIRTVIICHNLPEEEEQKLFDFFQV